MFRHQDGQASGTTDRKRGYASAARQRWSYLTGYDISVIDDAEQLIAIIKTRHGISDAQARGDVAEWMRGKHF